MDHWDYSGITNSPRQMDPDLMCSSVASPKSVANFDQSHMQHLSVELKLGERRRKRVRFSNDETLLRKEILITPILDEDSESVWWSQESLEQIHLEHKQRAAHFRATDGEEYNKSLLFLMKSDRKQQLEPLEHVRKHICATVKGGVRGLEGRIFPIISGCRKRHRKIVLATQDELRNELLIGTDEGESILRQRSFEASQPARQLAVRLAQADEMEARRFYRASVTR